jgi:hypothetical protein
MDEENVREEMRLNHVRISKFVFLFLVSSFIFFIILAHIPIEN